MKKAFSLVEMLVALVLITLLVGVAMFSFKYQLIMIKKAKTSGINRAIIYNQLKTSIESMKYYVVDDYDMLGNPMDNLHHFFIGKQKMMEYITINPLFSKEVAIVKLVCEGQNLIYQEEPLYKRIDFLKPEVLENSRSITLLKNLDKCEFEYIPKKNIPRQVILHVQNNEISPLYIGIKSDYNLSLGVIQDVIVSND